MKAEQGWGLASIFDAASRGLSEYLCSELSTHDTRSQLLLANALASTNAAPTASKCLIVCPLTNPMT